MAIVTGDRYLDFLVKFVEKQAGPLLEGTLVLKLNPVGLHYVHSRLEALQELEGLIAGAPIDYLRAYVSDLGDHRALEQLRRILRLLTSLKVVSVLPPPARDPTPVSLSPFGRLRVLELRGCDLSTSAARGLLELRHTLEKIVCHNSTDALRHVFASRIVDIRESPLWKRLASVSCACNGLVLMDESLQLLPVAETLDLSRNRFAKVDNLRKCTKLKHLDLGFNHLRTIASLNEVTCRIIKLVLRNNALTTLHGIENLKSVEGLDLSYNIISNFSEIELLASLSSLQNLWLEGNPICYARWYRAQVFSYFTNPEKLKLDEKAISTREAWKMQIILTSRQKRPAGYGFYSPAKYGAEQEGSFNSKRKKHSRLACIEDVEQRRYLGSEAFDQESTSCNSENLRRDDNVISDNESEILDLMNRVEFMKKERSVLWLREFRDWLDQTPEDMVESSKFTDNVLSKEKDAVVKSHKQQGGPSRYVSDSVQDSGDESITNILESDLSFTDTITGGHGQAHFDSSDKATSNPPMTDGSQEGLPILTVSSRKGELEASSQEEQKLLPLLPRESSVLDTLTAIDEILESRSSSAYPGSPPHYQEDILHRRQNLEEEFLQVSAGSYSAASSDSDTSCDSSSCKFGTSFPGLDQILNEEPNGDIADDHDANFFDEDYYERRNEKPCNRKNSISLDPYSEPISNIFKVPKPDHSKPSCTDDILADAGGGNSDHITDKSGRCLEKRKGKQVPKRRVVSPWEDDFLAGNVKLASQKLNGVLEIGSAGMEDGNMQDISNENGLCNSHGNVDKKLELLIEGNSPIYDADSLLMDIKFVCSPRPDTGGSIKSYFHASVADPQVSETCLQYVRCNCLLQPGSSRESEVAVLLSSESKLYLLLIAAPHDSSGTCLKVLGSHRLGDIKEVVVGIGLQVLRVYFENDTSYLFLTRTIEKSRSLLGLLRICDSNEETANRCSLRSWEHVQVKLFQKQVREGLKMSIFLYSMLLFWHKNSKGESWLLRSLFVIEGYMLVCAEDLMHFNSLADDVGVSVPYFSLDACCSIGNILEMVIEQKESRCVTLTLDHVESKKLPFPTKLEGGENEAKNMDSLLTWRLKWFSDDMLLRFVALLKAMYAGMTMSPLPVKCISGTLCNIDL